MQGPGLTATELQLVLTELAPTLAGCTVRDIARLTDRDDLLLFLDGPAGSGDRSVRRLALHIATDGRRARVTCTNRRFRKASFQQGPLIDRLGRSLRGATFVGVQSIPGERHCTLRWSLGEQQLDLHVELFGARGLWCLADCHGTILELSRLPNSAGRELRPTATYAPPTPRSDPPAESTPRFAAPVLTTVDAFFTGEDRLAEHTLLRNRLTQAADRAVRKLTHKIAGLERQRTEIDRVAEIRCDADLLLAYGFRAPRGTASLQVPDPDHPGSTRTLVLLAGVPIQVQANKLYQRARKLEEGATISAQRHDEATHQLSQLTALRDRVNGAEDPLEITTLEGLLDEFYDRGLLRRPKRAEPRGPKGPKGPSTQLRKITKGHNVRCFTSSEGHLIMVGRTNQQNDRLSLSIARGNDCWLHVGRGYAGSHVVIRLPKGKTPSLESLLDAGTLAIHFSKARNADRCEVIYTTAKNVRKPKGLPPGRVTTTDTKSIMVDIEPTRVRRLLDSAADW